MTPPTFQIGDEVETTNGTRFEISQLWEKPDGSFAYSDPSLRWHSADNLRLVNKKPLSPMSITYNYKPDDCEHGTFQVSCPCGRKAEIDPKLDEELKIGDWVRGIYNGHTFQIDYIKPRMESKTLDYSGKDEPMYLASSLRKLTPDEIKAHLHPIQVSATMDCSEFAEGMAKCQDKLWKIGIEARLSAIEKQLKEFDGEISHLLASIQECLMESGDVEARTRCREMAIEKRLDFVEKFQRGQAEAAQYRRNMYRR